MTARPTFPDGEAVTRDTAHRWLMEQAEKMADLFVDPVKADPWQRRHCAKRLLQAAAVQMGGADILHPIMEAWAKIEATRVDDYATQSALHADLANALERASEQAMATHEDLWDRAERQEGW